MLTYFVLTFYKTKLINLIIFYLFILLVNSNHPYSMSKDVHPFGYSNREDREINPDLSKLLNSLEKQFLNKLGLNKKPKPKSGLKVPEYMKQLYQSIINKNLDEKLDDSRISLKGTPNTIKSHQYQETGEQHLYFEKMILKFNMTLKENELLMGAELRISSPFNNSHQFLKSTTRHYRIQLFDILSNLINLKDISNIENELILRQIDTHVVNIDENKWIRLDASPAVERWIISPLENYGLYLKITNVNGSSIDEKLINNNPVLIENRLSEENKPLLLTYTCDGLEKQSDIISRMKRSSSGRKHRKKGRRDTCRRNSLYVDFSDVGWNDWIVAPLGYQAYFCNGECPYPLADHLNSTNHAIVQTLVNSVSPSKVPRACCVPTELSPISMLYVDEYEKVVLKNYQDMVVEACGCR